MAQQSVIYPSQPLLIVDRQWRTRKQRHADVPTFPVNPSKRDITISVFDRKTLATAECIKTQASKPATKYQRQKEREYRFVDGSSNLSAPQPKKRRPSNKKPNKPVLKIEDPVKPVEKSPLSTDADPAPKPVTLQLAEIVPTSSTTFYGYTNRKIKPDAQDLLNYYSYGIGRAFYPMQNVISFDINPVKAAWMPQAAADEALLNTVLLCSDVHRKYLKSNMELAHSSPYFRQAITHVNARLATGEVCDSLIGAVSCLALIEHYLMNQKSSAMHHAGMTEMIRVRGGMQAVRKPLQMKIYRADLIPAVDNLTSPKLPRLRATVSSLHNLMFPDGFVDPAFADALVATGMGISMIDIMTTLSALSKSLKYAITHKLTIPSRSFDEDTMGIQYDLLLMPMAFANDIDIACRSAALIYMKSLTREDPCNFDPIVDPMIVAITNIPVISSNARFLLWTSFMGAAFAVNMTSRLWFHKKVAALREYLGLTSWEEAEAILRSISWIREVHDEAGRLVWDLLESTSTSTTFTQKLAPPLTSVSLPSTASPSATSRTPPNPEIHSRADRTSPHTATENHVPTLDT